MHRLILVLSLIIGLATVLVGAEKCTVPSQRVQCGDYTCNKHTLECDQCHDNKECWDPAFICNSDGKCELQSLADSFKTNAGGVIGGILVGLGVCSIAVIAGVGGGGILVPMYMVLLGVPSISAVALSQATITGQASFNVVLQLFRHHPEYQKPNPTRPVINWPLLSFWLPISLIGTMYGNLAGKVVPEWFRLSLLFLLLGYVLYRTILRLKAQRDADRQRLLEKEKEAIEKAEREANDGEDREILAPERQGLNTVNNNEDDAEGPVQNPPPAYPQLPLLPIALAFLTFAPLFGFNYAKINAVSCGAIGYWLIVAVATVYNLGISLGYRTFLRRLHLKIIMDEEDPEEVPFKWNWKTTMLFPAVSVFAGGAASLLGIGGGLILSFLLLEAGLVPEEQSATSGMITFLVAFESFLQFIIQGEVRFDYGALFVGVGICSTILGQVYVRQIRKRGWRFLIIMALAFIMIGSMVALTAVGIRDTVVLLQHGGSIGFGELCPPKLTFNHHHGNSTQAPTALTSLTQGFFAPGTDNDSGMPRHSLLRHNTGIF